tara:strand:+ start:653 stop:1069 length:417 start_codon:yes stop_codon:yes gene_type:complete
MALDRVSSCASAPPARVHAHGGAGHPVGGCQDHGGHEAVECHPVSEGVGDGIESGRELATGQGQREGVLIERAVGAHEGFCALRGIIDRRIAINRFLAYLIGGVAALAERSGGCVGHEQLRIVPPELVHDVGEMDEQQ